VCNSRKKKEEEKMKEKGKNIDLILWSPLAFCARERRERERKDSNEWSF
jgi:hypothetical protein